MGVGEPSGRGNAAGHGLAVVSVLVVSRVAVYREGIALLLAESPRTRVVDTATTSEGALSRIRELRPDVALVDLPTEELCSLALTLDGSAETRLVALVTSEAEGEFAMRAGAGICGYATHKTSIEQLVTIIERAATNGRLVPPSTRPAGSARARR